MDCVPYIQRGVVEGDWCVQSTRYNFGVDAEGKTLACNSESHWVLSPPLVGIRTLRLPCPPEEKGVAQSPDGVPLSCIGGAWTADYSVPLF